MPKEIRPNAPINRSPPMMLPSDLSNQPRSSATWSAEDDETLMNARASGLNWQPLAKKYFAHKTANACRKRHERLMERRNAEEFDGIKLDTLAKEYMECRQEMWKILADRVGDRWQLIEAKCMEKGLKNLQAAHRSALRKERGMDESGDSGIGCSSEAENELDDGYAEASNSQAHLHRLPPHHQQNGRRPQPALEQNQPPEMYQPAVLQSQSRHPRQGPQHIQLIGQDFMEQQQPLAPIQRQTRAPRQSQTRQQEQQMRPLQTQRADRRSSRDSRQRRDATV